MRRKIRSILAYSIIPGVFAGMLTLLIANVHAAQAPIIDSRDAVKLNSDMPVATASIATQSDMDDDGATCGDAALMPKGAKQVDVEMTEEDEGMACWEEPAK